MFEILTVSDVKHSLGQLVKNWRKREGLSQQQLGVQLGLSRLTIQNLESGRNPTLDTLLLTFQYFDQLELFNNYVQAEIQNSKQESLY